MIWGCAEGFSNFQIWTSFVSFPFSIWEKLLQTLMMQKIGRCMFWFNSSCKDCQQHILVPTSPPKKDVAREIFCKQTLTLYLVGDIFWQWGQNIFFFKLNGICLLRFGIWGTYAITRVFDICNWYLLSAFLVWPSVSVGHLVVRRNPWSSGLWVSNVRGLE